MSNLMLLIPLIGSLNENLQSVRTSWTDGVARSFDVLHNDINDDIRVMDGMFVQSVNSYGLLRSSYNESVVDDAVLQLAAQVQALED